MSKFKSFETPANDPFTVPTKINIGIGIGEQKPSEYTKAGNQGTEVTKGA